MGTAVATGIVVTVTVALDPQDTWFDVVAAVFWSLMFAFPFVAYYGLPLLKAGMRVRYQISIDDVRRSDFRAPVLYLRPFAAEAWGFATFDSRAATFEGYLTAALEKRIGPSIALGNPEDYLPAKGATRTYASDQGWYENFERLARESACMVMVAASSQNLVRELALVWRDRLQRRLFSLRGISLPRTSSC